MPQTADQQAARRPILQHNQASARVWSAGGPAYDRISRQIADALEHAVDRLDPKPGERILDVATGTGWTARRIASLSPRPTESDEEGRSREILARLDQLLKRADREARAAVTRLLRRR